MVHLCIWNVVKNRPFGGDAAEGKMAGFLHPSATKNDLATTMPLKRKQQKYIQKSFVPLASAAQTRYTLSTDRRRDKRRTFYRRQQSSPFAPPRE